MSNLQKFKHQQPSEDILITNVQKLMRERKLNEAELSRRTEIPKPTLHKILSGKTADPRISTIKILADFFEVTLDDLYQENLSFAHKPLPQGISIPIISWSDSLNAKTVINELTPSNWQQWIIVDGTEDQFLYGLTSKPCFEPYFPRGTILVVDSKQKANDGDLVVVHYPNTNEATLRELSIDGPNRLLMPLNDTYAPDKLDDSIKILGMVVQSRFLY